MNDKSISIRLQGEINDKSVKNLIDLVEKEFRTCIKKFYIMISSPGGYVDPGLTAYNFLKGLPIEVITTNFGSVDSISTIIFCAGAKRYSVPNSRFIIHDIRNNYTQPITMFEN